VRTYTESKGAVAVMAKPSYTEIPWQYGKWLRWEQTEDRKALFDYCDIHGHHHLSRAEVAKGLLEKYSFGDKPVDSVKQCMRQSFVEARKRYWIPAPDFIEKNFFQIFLEIFVRNLECRFQVGDRVQVEMNAEHYVATVRFFGETEFAPGNWIGLELDVPVGTNDGRVSNLYGNKIRYFRCPPRHGIFMRPNLVTKPESCMAVTIQISAQDGLESPLTVIATSMGGNELATRRLSPRQSLADLRDVLAEDLGMPAHKFELVATAGQLLDESRNAQLLSEVLSETFRQD